MKMRTILLFILPLLLLASCRENQPGKASKIAGIDFLGPINYDYIIMSIDIYADSSITGEYIYENTLRRVTLKGKIAGEHIILEEYDELGEHVGRLAGDLKGYIFSGYWSYPENDDPVLPFKLCRQNGIVNSGTYRFDDCDLTVTIAEDRSYTIYRKDSLLDDGRYSLSYSEGELFISFGTLHGLYYTDTIMVQNYGNAMNEYIRLDFCDYKYIEITKEK